MKRLAIPTLLVLSGIVLVYVGAGALAGRNADRERIRHRARCITQEARRSGSGALLYGAYGVSRLISIALDGVPSGALMIAMTIELAVGAAALIALVRTGLRPT